ncbi:MAG TPA: sigma-70 family RNA polymerase sigma factor [Trebonia sp.]|nr:sigma-70 family RNA polymerase sigma factor [Trebonia sp.]
MTGVREEETTASLGERFEEHRGRLRALAYRMLGSLDEADDAVQETWVRFSAAGADQVENLGGWLTTIASRVCLNTLRARAARPESLAGSRVPDPVLSPAEGPTPEQEALLADSVGLALLVVLDTLTPAERVAFVLHDVFDFPFGEIAPMLGRTPEAARQLASRARHRVKAAGAREPDGTVAAQQAVVNAFFAAARAGDLAGLVELLDPEVVLRTDGFAAAPAVLRGAATVAGAALGGASPGAEFRPVLVNGAAGMLITMRGRPAGLMAFTVAGGRITAIDGITDPHRLRRLVS